MNPYQWLVDRVASTPLGARWARRLATVVDRRLIPWSGGRLSSGFGTEYGGRILLLHARGARSAVVRTVPLLYTPHGAAFVVVGSRGGDERHPAWYFNLRAHPQCEIEVGGQRIGCEAREVEGTERDELWALAVAGYAGYAGYQARVQRRIPLVLITPRADSLRSQ